MMACSASKVLLKVRELCGGCWLGLRTLFLCGLFIPTHPSPIPISLRTQKTHRCPTNAMRRTATMACSASRALMKVRVSSLSFALCVCFRNPNPP